MNHRAAFRTCNLFRLALRPESAHAGQGLVDAVRIATRADLAGPCSFIDYAEVPPGCSIGDHRHADDEEEFYLVLSGRATMRLEDDTFPVGPGDLIRNPPGGLHGLSNSGNERVRLFIFELIPAVE